MNAIRSVRIYVSERCNARCPNCFNREKRKDGIINIQFFENLCRYFSLNKVRIMKIMGGEPTLHPLFGPLMQLAQEHFPQVNLFTNAINDNVFLFSPRDEDSITYNFRFHRVLTIEKLMLDKPGERNLEIQVTTNIDHEHMWEDILRICSLDKNRIHPCFTLDCTSDIFEVKDIVIPKYEYLLNHCHAEGLSVRQDHLLPLCFLKGTKIPSTKYGAKCSSDCMGLIGVDGSIMYCNQFNRILGVIQKDEGFIPFQDYVGLLFAEADRIQENSKTKGCQSCAFYRVFCTGGCFAGKESITKVYPF